MCSCETSEDFNDKEKRLAILNGFMELTSLKFSIMKIMAIIEN